MGAPVNARGGQLEILKWLRANGCPWDTNTPSVAYKAGHFELLKWANEHSDPIGTPGQTTIGFIVPLEYT